MFSMAVAGLAKSLIAVTMTLNPAAAHHGPGSYTIRPGDTLSQIAARAYGSAADWPAIWWANRRQVPYPDLIPAGVGRGPERPRKPGHRRLARVRGARLIPAPGVTCLHRVAPRRGQAGGAVPAARRPGSPPSRQPAVVATGAFRPHGRAGTHDKTPVPPSHPEPPPGSTPYTTGLLATAERWSGCSGRRSDAGQPTLMHEMSKLSRRNLCTF